MYKIIYKIKPSCCVSVKGAALLVIATDGFHWKEMLNKVNNL